MKKAQASAEYILVLALILLIIVPTIYLFYSHSHKSSEEIKQSQVNKIGTDIIDAAEQVYYLGKPSKTTLDAIMPDGVEKIEIWHNQEIVFFLNDGSELAFKSRVNITTDNLCTEQTERCHYNFNKTISSQGLKHITIEARGDYVVIGGGDEEPAAGSLVCIDTDGDGYGVCPDNCNITTGCKFDGHDCDDDHILIHPGATEVCNGVDDDCDAGTADGSGESAPDNSNQKGVCSGSTQSCIAGSWQDDYGEVANYEATETTCYDNLDNDCNTLTDCDDGDCLGEICDEAGTMICIDIYGPECVSI